MRRKLLIAFCLVIAGCLTLTSAQADDKTAPPAGVDVFDAFPTVWIGVRLEEVPAALAAHVPQGKFLLINVAEDSPAEQAGLERYDVVVSFNDQQINELNDLLRAIQENGPDREARMDVIHRGVAKTVSITPKTRNLTDKVVFKYEEDDLIQSDPFERYFGHRLKVGPDGHFLFEPQGRLDMLPDDIKELLEKMTQLNPQTFEKYDIDILNDPARFSISGTPGANAAVTLRIDENGQSLSIKRELDGKFTVERKDPDGSSKTAVYENEEQFQQNDPDAYRTYERSLKSRVFSAWVNPPDWTDLNRKQFQFQSDLQVELERLREQVSKALEEARSVQQEMADQKANDKRE